MKMQKAGVDLAPAIRNDETAEALKPVSKAEKTIRLKARFSLIVIWMAASVVCLFFVLFSFTSTPLPSYISNTLFLDKPRKNLLPGENADLQQINDTGANDAFVFVNVDKRFFLTHFPSGMLEDETESGISENSVNNSAVSKNHISIIRKIKSVRKVKTSTIDFDVKPVPQ